MLENYPTILIPEEVSEILRIGQSEIYKLLNNGKIEGYKVGKTWRIPKQNVINYINTKIKWPQTEVGRANACPTLSFGFSKQKISAFFSNYEFSFRISI